MLTRLISRLKGGDAPKEISYEVQREMVQSSDAKVRLKLAENSTTRPEILYFLAKDDTSEIRRAIAGNPGTPLQADLMLVDDSVDEVRADLALKIGRLIPDMPKEEQERVREMTIETLELLAEDQLPRVRAVISEEIKHSANVPKKVIKQLARDLHHIVSAPVLEYSPLLGDDDLKEIIAAGAASEALSAIANRESVSSEVSDAVVATLDVPAVATLLANQSAQIREDTLDVIIDHAEEVESWHEPMVMRPELSVRAMRRIAGFVASSLVERLAEKHKLPPDMTDDLLDGVRRRLNQSTGDVQEDSKAHAIRLHSESNLDDDTVLEAVDGGDQDFCVTAFALLAGLSRQTISQILSTRNGELITALVWKAGLSMRTAMRTQAKLGHVNPKKVVNARNGTDYPMTEEHMSVLIERYE